MPLHPGYPIVGGLHQNSLPADGSGNRSFFFREGLEIESQVPKTAGDF